MMGITHKKLTIISFILILVLMIISVMIEYSNSSISGMDRGIIKNQNEIISLQVEMSDIKNEIYSYLNKPLDKQDCKVYTEEEAKQLLSFIYIPYETVETLQDLDRCTYRDEVKGLLDKYNLTFQVLANKTVNTPHLLINPLKFFTFEISKVRTFLYWMQSILFVFALIVNLILVYMIGKPYLTGIENKLKKAEERIKQLEEIVRNK